MKLYFLWKWISVSALVYSYPGGDGVPWSSSSWNPCFIMVLSNYYFADSSVQQLTSQSAWTLKWPCPGFRGTDILGGKLQSRTRIYDFVQIWMQTTKHGNINSTCYVVRINHRYFPITLHVADVSFVLIHVSKLQEAGIRSVTVSSYLMH